MKNQKINKLSLVLLLLIGVLLQIKAIELGLVKQLPVVAQQKVILKPSETLIAFDIDEVLITGREKTYKTWLDNHLQFKETMNKVIERAKQKGMPIKDAFDIVNATIQEDPSLAAQAEEFKGAFTIAPKIEGTIAIARKLSKKGYTIITASNMTTSTYQAMVDNGTLPKDIFSKDFFFVQTSPNNKKPDGTYYEKPAAEYYQNLVAYVKVQFPHIKHIIFTDDKKANADGAKPYIISIHFLSPEQLAHDLENVGVMTE